MRAGCFGQGLELVAGAVFALSVSHGAAEAARHKSAGYEARHSVSSHAGSGRVSERTRRVRRYSGGGALQCVPFARENSGIELTGNAGTWWNSASGLYERGARPEVGSILNFRATGHMRMGHVAVVTNVINPRHIEIDHANWGAPGQISRNIDVVDVSPDNDWTAVRVALSQAEDYGSTYPTYGFIYDRPDRGVMVANGPTTGGVPTTSALKQANEPIRLAATAPVPEEVAEAAEDDDSAPRYSSRSRHARRSTSHATATSRRGYSPFPSATTFRVSTRPTAIAKPTAHRSSKRRL